MRIFVYCCNCSSAVHEKAQEAFAGKWMGKRRSRIIILSANSRHDEGAFEGDEGDEGDEDDESEANPGLSISFFADA